MISYSNIYNVYRSWTFFCSPGDVLHRLQINTLQSEKESMQLKLQQAQAKISSLEMETVDLRTKFGKATGSYFNAILGRLHASFYRSSTENV